MTTAPRTRLRSDERRAQLLDLGVRLFATRSLPEISIDLLAETAGISRGLLYHYFGGLAGFQEAVVRRAAADLIARTAPPAEGDAFERLLVSVRAYVEFVDENYEGYLSLVTGAKSGNESLRAIYDEARAALTDRIFASDSDHLLEDNASMRLLVRGWSALAEEMVLDWKVNGGVDREELVGLITGALAALAGVGVAGESSLTDA
ncbi:TetR/AcrR family transcriptional regulator [Nocardioides sp. CER19]|uniref:TetR/AcrR family transcriptional regulator n=1 Tax=Nocardioides sp. CER19 TaxID=3038538 RepID=UPI00244846B3|nr:TetR/AcrR family transcriptional regulator [Nocardioides sp. CER19]MDH2414762.1 TetR/AcrR family transcriptional regulator [Nocardioides sp. CER19]